MRRLCFLELLVCMISLWTAGEVSAQFTSAVGNYDVFVRKTASSQFGLLRTSVELPSSDGVPVFTINQKGIIFSRQYPLGSFDPIVISRSDQLMFVFEGFFRIGGGMGSGDIGEPHGPYLNTVQKYYVTILDIFSMDIVPTYTHVFRNGTGLTAKVGLTLINLGGSAAILEGGVFRESGILVANILPVQVTGSLMFDFGRSALGFSVLINASSILNYTLTPKELYNDGYRGMQSTTLIKRVAFQIMYAS
jgi:hypothetical protein